MTEDAIIAKIRKLLALSRSADVHEAAAAAAKAQELLSRHQIDGAMLEVPEPGAAPAPDVPVEERVVFRFRGAKVDTWLLSLLGSVCAVNGCRSFYRRGWDRVPATYTGVGVPDDLAACSFLAEYLSGEVERLAEAGQAADRYRAKGRTWLNSFRLGAVAEIVERLHVAKRATRAKLLAAARDPEAARREAETLAYAAAREEAERTGDAAPLRELAARPPAPVYALARVEAALVRLEERETRAKDFIAEKYGKLRGRSRSRSNVDWDGYAKGKAAGANVDLAPGTRGLK
jgi:hypothetical protein